SGVTQDVPRAMALYEQAARAGHLPAAESLAMNYLSGERVPYDEAKAMSWLRFGMPTPSAMPVAATAATHARNRPLAWGDISPAVARAGGLAEQSGYYVLDAQQLAQRAGGPEQLLALSREQINSNLKWFDHMAPIAVRPTTPLQPQVQALYQQAYETHEVERAIRHALECRLGLTPSPPQRPARLDELKRDANAQAARQREREASAAAGSGFVNFLNALGGALRATAGSGGGGG